MNHTEYLKIEDADTALAVRLAVTMGWLCSLQYSITRGGIRVFVEDPTKGGWVCALFDPFTDASIPYGLIGCGIWGVYQFQSDGRFMVDGDTENILESKTHAILNACCQADPMGHWAKFIGEKTS